MIKALLLIAAGGACGSVARHGFNQLAMKWLGTTFPWGTFGVNVLGSLLIGLLAGPLAYKTDWPQELRLFMVVGVLGGFTTFSAFSLDAVLLLERGALLTAGLYIAGSVVLSIAATFAGLLIFRMLVV